MAEPVSSVLTIVTVSLAVVRETTRYIQEINVVNELIGSLLKKLKDLHRLIKVVETTYRGAHSSDSNVSSQFVGKVLNACQKRLSDVKPLVYELASRDSETWLQKVALKRRSDNVKKEIEQAIQDINTDMEHIRTGISCWSLDVASATRRISEAIATQQALTIRDDLQQIADRNTSPLSRTLSNAETLFSHDPIAQLRRTSTATSGSRPSISSASSRVMQIQSDDNESIVSHQDPIKPKAKSDWVDFHFQIAKCEGNQARTEEIRTILQQHSDASSLARSTDCSLRTPLHLAAQRGDIELGRMLIKFGADVNAKDSEPSTVLDLAVANNQRKFVAFLLSHDVDETAILKRNEQKFKEMKRIIEFSKNTTQKVPKTATKKQDGQTSWSSRMRLLT
ncbi:hypothetical protein BKA66DRAFT_214207 [Pyrenochaeta sp. MPI-SDFR-AT-0127]|nr:hypothetical protein BKA66DRAFT_214207 [Pyrenochaeta sp. MPI-SDFR-AT-0127]